MDRTTGGLRKRGFSESEAEQVRESELVRMKFMQERAAMQEINVFTNWDSGNGRNVDELAVNAEESGKILCNRKSVVISFT